jgi:Flp pilus assembly protein TadD
MSRPQKKRSVKAVRSVKSDPSWAVHAPLAALLFLAIVVYLPSLGGEFLWDDNTSVTESAIVHDGGGGWKAWIAPPASHPDYFPLTTDTFWIEWRLWGAHPFGYRLINLLLHAGAAVFLWRLLRELALPAAWAAAVLFAVHPVNVESVAWIAERKNVLCLIFALPAFQFFVRWHRTGAVRDYRISLACHLAALAAKASVVGLPFVFAAYLFWRGARPGKREWIALAPFVMASLIFGLLVMHFQHDRAIGAWDIVMPGILGRIGGAVTAFWFYFGKAISPVGLATIYPRWSIDPPQAAHLLLAVVSAAGICGLWVLRDSRARAVAFGLTTYAILLGPALGLIKMSFMRHALVADHFQHLALPAIIALVVCGGASLLPGLPPKVVQGARAAWAVIGLTFFGLCWHRAELHASHEALWTDALAKNPASDQPHNILGAIHANRGDFPAAEAHLRKAIELGSPEAVTFLGNVLCSQGRFQEALPWLEKGVAARVNPGAAYTQLARAYVGLNRTEDALRTLETGAAQNPDSLMLQSTLGMAFLMNQEPAKAVTFLSRCEELDPGDATTKMYLSQALEALGRGAEAARKRSEALRINPALADPRPK